MSGRVEPHEASELISRLWKGHARGEDGGILTDHFAPVEALLNPITGKTYALESEYDMNRPPAWGMGDSNMALALLAAIIMAWLSLLSSSST